jgi:galactoside O-acetyltransferase
MKKIIGKCIEKGFTIFSKIRVNSFDTYGEYISADSTAVIDPGAYIKIFNPPNPPTICLEIGENSHIFSKFSFLRPAAKIRIGKRCQLGNSQFICADKIEIGDDVIMAWGSTVMDSDSHALLWEDRKKDVLQGLSDYKTNPDNFISHKDWSKIHSEPILIGSKCWIGFEVAILKGVTIGEGSVVGARSVVTKNVPPYTVVAGNPAKVIRVLKTKNELDL